MSWKNEQVSEGETRAILTAARQCLGVPGDFVEMGCYRGDTSMLLAEVLWESEKNGEQVETRQRNDGDERQGEARRSSRKKLWLYDSFEGLPEKEPVDESIMGVDFEKGVLAASRRELKQRFLRSGLAVPKIVKGWFGELTDKDLPVEIAFGFLDGDFYQSTRDGLKLIWPRLSEGGKLLVHDYANEALPGVAKAVDEYFREMGVAPKIVVIESLAVVMR